MPSSESANLIRWCATRLGWLFVALAAALAGLSLLLRPAPLPTAFELLKLAALAWLLIAQFRLLDDLFDREHDRARHPERELVATPSMAPFQVALAALGVTNLVAIFGLLSARAALGLTTLDLAALAGYALSRRVGLPRLVHAHGVLLKYPAMIYILADAPPRLDGLGWTVLTGSFAALALYELADDVELRTARGSQGLLVLHALVLAFAVGWQLFGEEAR